MNRLRDATARLATRIASRAGDSATYTRDAGTGSESSQPLVIVQGRERDIAKDSTLAEMFRRSGWDRDILVSVAAFAATGFNEPIPGDQISFPENNGTTTLEVFLPDGERAWRYSDQTRTILRIHCKLAS